MFRRVVSLIVMLGFITGQLVAMPHAHGENGEPFDHNSRPHFHISWFAHAGHGHDHGHAHHHQSDGTHSHSHSPEAENKQGGHDSDAVYLPSDIGVSLPSKSIGPLDDFPVGTTLAIVATPSTTWTTDCSVEAFSPDECSPACPLYLALRALRI